MKWPTHQLTTIRARRVAAAPALRVFVSSHPLLHASFHNSPTALCSPRASFVIPPVERLTSPRSPRLSSSYVDAGHGRSATGSAGKEDDCTDGFRFAVKMDERGLHDHGVTPEAKDFIADAEEEYRASSAYLHEVPGGPSLPETESYIDAATGQEVTSRRIAAPFGETYIPSNKERFASRGHAGELARQRDVVDKPFMLDEHAQLNLKKERQLMELLDAPMPALEKAEEVAHFLLESFYPQALALQPRTGESIMLLYSQASYLKRLNGPPGATENSAATPQLAAGPRAASPLAAQDVVFLSDMRLLYTHQKRCFVCPTPLLLEHLMVALSVVAEPSTPAFHLANRLLLDADRFVLLPTRTTYTAFLKVCQVNNAMQFALARYTDALQALQLPVDAPMLTALLKGLNESGYVEEAVALLARVAHVPVSTPLLNASLETLLLSDQALSCFSLFDSMSDSPTKPDAATYTLLLLACEKSGQWKRVTAILSDMQQRRVRGDARTLNLLLKGLLQERLHSFAAQLYQTMQVKHVPVWPALEAGVRPLLR
ncbi:putative mitochondrial hypothetical protein [Leptomonas pyrrhocoris]|uniref:Uncharacterized protein n=1 Tax=Leptomonas pyrrhocoris TaxID=157538 RepID=A0A0M9FSZ4_LEPPY|nr:putative mitochondrial hypothetical protein [Leptomonas pyrrhocoris]XP_015653797.1 putative mitochondrial hypothetical protein [Leptomonas pyrrhocoris]XP_015653798.1 putative mitochondrial hypothetical protein [Leptomonas pyrrhocoris]KPA75357.1 putative mitochondrial hypothetical protein [Leptomonas pyrrhocoris]KPA75358.1 putative mitochondrial hypothetical protein [Leptomonas pyrrhocoris]KPA75359.1 putative mitochondrial hypothetical protein [Leptomonas pyrrhocoris]|eukprot:XP_015653796.1 putative mitochondrial hypothetical protein [Leptomonas pyrrhocoris]